MARITWDNVVAPDYRGSMVGFNNANQALNSAFDSARGGLADFDKTRRERVQRTLAERMSRITTDEAMQAALQSGSLYEGINRDLINPAAYERAMKRPGELLSNETTRENNEQTAWGNDRIQAYDSNSRAVAPFQAAVQAALARQASGEGSLAEVEQAQSALATASAELGMSSEELAGNLGLSDNLQRDGQSQRNTNLNYDESAYGFGQKILTDEENALVASEMALYEENFVEAADAVAHLRGRKDLAPHIRARLAKQMGAPGLVTAAEISSIGSGGGSGTVTDNPFGVANYQLVGAGLSLPDDAKTLGDVRAWQRKVVNEENYWTDGAGKTQRVNSSAIGPYQIVGKTLEATAKKLWPNDWESKDYRSIEVHDAMGRQLYEDRMKGSNKAAGLRSEWAGLSQADAEAMAAGMPWEEARNIIAARESNVNLDVLYNATEGPAQRARATAVVEASNDPMVTTYYENAGDETSIEKVATALRKEDEFSGISKVGIENMLRSIQTRANALADERGLPRRTINAKTGAEILRRSWGEDTIGNNLKNIFFSGNPTRGGWLERDTAINDDLIDGNIVSILSGGIESQANQRDNIADAAAQEAGVKAQIALNQRLMQAALAQGKPTEAAKYKARIDALMEQQVNVRADEPRTGQGVAPGRRRQSLTPSNGAQVRVRLPSRTSTRRVGRN